MPYTLLPDEDQPRGFRLLDDEPTKADPKIGKPEELTFAEKYIAPVLEKIGIGEQDTAGKLGLSRGGAVGRFAMGAADPGVAVVQLAANAVGAGDPVNKRIQEVEKEYQAARGSEADTFDPLRAIGSTVIAAPIPLGAGAKGAMGLLKAAGVGGALGSLDTVKDGGENFWTEKGKQAALGAATGAVVSPLMNALARVVSPKASTNEAVKMLREEGVNPTVGQTAGGWANTLEEKMSSLPIMGDRIAAMRKQAIDEFNNAAINRTVAPIGERVQGAGHEAVAEAGDKLSAAYQNALGRVNHVNFNTPTFNAKFGQLQQMAANLEPPLAQRFERVVNDKLLNKMSPNGSILGEDLKFVDSELGTIARKWGAGGPAEQEFADAVKQLQAIVKEGVADARPDVAFLLKKADKGWAQLVRVEGAAKAASRGGNADGVFTPAQLGGSVRANDYSVRGRAVARGEALMQDLSEVGQSVLGNKYPDSGTPGRVFAGIGGMMAGAIHPAIPAALIAGAGAYTPPVQNVLRYLLTARPDQAPAVANYLRRLVGPATLAAVPATRELSIDRR